jgi:DNA repair protein RecN (Recombination protein N)
MLRHLRVTNFAILSDVAIELGDGMNVLTGETGAGKSLIVEAVNLLRGGRASADIPRAGADEAVVEAIVEIPADLAAHVASVIDGAGLPRGDNGEVFIRRVIQRGGRSRTYVNGALTTLARLAELGALLIDLSGQHQHQGLVDPGRHLEILDAFAGEPALVAAMTAAWTELRRCDDDLLALGGDEREREARLDYLRYQLEELDGAALSPGEDAAIDLERARLASVDQLQGAARAAEELLYGGDDSARDRVAAAAREVERAARTDPGLEPVTRQLGEIETLIDDAADHLRGYADKLEGDPERLAWLDTTLAINTKWHADGRILWHLQNNDFTIRGFGLKLAQKKLLGWEEANDKALEEHVKMAGGRLADGDPAVRISGAQDPVGARLVEALLLRGITARPHRTQGA